MKRLIGVMAMLALALCTIFASFANSFAKGKLKYGN